MAGQIHALVAVDDGIESQYIQSTLPDNENIEIVGIINGIEESWRTLQETSPDLLLVACTHTTRAPAPPPDAGFKITRMDAMALP